VSRSELFGQTPNPLLTHLKLVAPRRLPSLLQALDSMSTTPSTSAPVRISIVALLQTTDRFPRPQSFASPSAKPRHHYYHDLHHWPWICYQ
jgi:hypothetical protein